MQVGVDGVGHGHGGKMVTIGWRLRVMIGRMLTIGWMVMIRREGLDKWFSKKKEQRFGCFL